MRKKRRAAEAFTDEQTNEGSDPVLQQQGSDTKRVKLSPLSKTTLQDVPTRLLRRILVKAVVMEVKSMKLAKSVWKEKADLVISRLKNVCLLWNGILTTNEFLTKVRKVLDDTAQETIRLDILHQSWIDYPVLAFTTMKEEIFMIVSKEDQSKVNSSEHKVNVYDHNNMAEVKEVIALPGERPLDIEGCNVSSCVYVLCINRESLSHSVLRITKAGEHQFKISPWISDLRPSVTTISVFPNGNLCVPHGNDPVALSIYDANGALMSSAELYGFGFVDRVIQKPNGNRVLASINDDLDKRLLTEIDTDGKVQRQHVSSLGAGSSVNVADRYGRIVITKPFSGIELLDSELNPLKFPRQSVGEYMNLHDLHYNSERNEVISTHVVECDSSFLTTFRFTDE